MKIYFIAVTLFFYVGTSFAQESVQLISPLVRTEYPPTSDSKTFSNYYLSQHPKSSNVDQLLKEFEDAQKYYFVKSFSLARQYYEKVVAMSDIDEWNPIQREIIYLSYLRLSELDSNRSEEWLRKGLVFASELDPKKFLISKEVQTKIQSLQSKFQNEHLIWDTTAFRDDFNMVIINGQTVDLRKKKLIKIPSGKFRVTFLSDIYKPQTFIASSQQIPLLVPIRIPFVSGTCQKPIVNNEGELPSDLKVIYPDHCMRMLVDNKWDSLSLTKTDSVPVQFNVTHHQPERSQKTKFYKKKWFWITVGAIATAAVVSAQKEGTKKPTHESVSGF